MKLLQCHIRVRSVYIYKKKLNLILFFSTKRIVSNEFSGDWNHIDSIKSIFFVPNSVIATMIMTLNVDKKPMVPMVAGAIDTMFKNPKDMFWTGRVMDALFDGIPVDCSSDDFQAKAVCSVFQTGEVKAVQPVNATHFKFSLFAAVRLADSPFCLSNRSFCILFFLFSI